MNNKYNWNKIYEDSSPRLLGTVRRYVGDESVAEDILHDGFMTAIKKEHTYGGHGSFDGWLNRIVINTALQHLRSNKKEGLKDGVDMIENTLHEENSHQQEGPEFSLKELLEAIDTLPDHHKAVFNLYVLEKFKHNEIGEMLGISAGTSKSHLARGRKKLQQTLLERSKDKKERTRLSLMWLFTNEGWQHRLDQEFQQAFSHFTIPPSKPFAVSAGVVTKSSLIKAIVDSSLLVKVGVIASVAMVAFLTFWYIRLETNNSPMPEQDNIKLEEPVNFPKPVQAVHLNTNSLPKKKVTQLSRKQRQVEDSLLLRTVVVKKVIVVKDTVYEHH